MGLPIFWLICFDKVLFKPFILIYQRFYSIIHKVINFCGETDEMNWTKVEAVH